MIRYVVKEKETFKRYSLVANEVADVQGGAIADDSVAWNSNYRAFRINDKTLKGCIEIKINETLYPGDIVKVKCEICNLTGVKAKIAFDTQGGLNQGINQSAKTNEFEYIETNFTVRTENTYKVLIGVFTADVGDFYIRNVEINVISKTEPKFVYAARAYKMKFGAGTFSNQVGYTNDDCTCTIDSTNREITITHDKPFLNYIGIAQASVVAKPGSTAAAISVRVLGETKAGFKLKFFDENGVVIDPATLIPDNTLWVNAIHFGD